MFLPSRARIPAPQFAPSPQPARLLLPRDTSFWTSRFVGGSTRPLAGGGKVTQGRVPNAGSEFCQENETGMSFGFNTYCSQLPVLLRIGRAGASCRARTAFGSEVRTNLDARAMNEMLSGLVHFDLVEERR